MDFVNVKALPSSLEKRLRQIIQGVAREMGYSKVEFVDMEFNKLLPSLKEGKVDVVISCLTVTDDRKKEVDFTQPYLVSANVAVGSTDAKTRSTGAMKGKRIAVETGSIHVKQARQYSDTVVECGGAEEALKLIMDKRADFAIMDNYTARFFITHFYNGKLSIMAELQDDTDTRVGIAVAKGNKEANIINRSVQMRLFVSNRYNASTKI